MLILILLPFLPLEIGTKHSCGGEFVGGRRSLLQFTRQRCLCFIHVRGSMAFIFIMKPSSFCVVFHNTTALPKPEGSKRNSHRFSGQCGHVGNHVRFDLMGPSLLTREPATWYKDQCEIPIGFYSNGTKTWLYLGTIRYQWVFKWWMKCKKMATTFWNVIFVKYFAFYNIFWWI